MKTFEGTSLGKIPNEFRLVNVLCARELLRLLD